MTVLHTCLSGSVSGLKGRLIVDRLFMVRSLLKRLKGKILLSSDATGERPPTDSRARARALVQGLQNEICAGLEQLDGNAHFQE